MTAAAWLLAVVLSASFCVLLSRRPSGVSTSGPWKRAAERFRGNRAGMVALYLIVTLYIVTLLAPLLAPYNPAAQLDITGLQSVPPSANHLFGTDIYSRDVLSRVLHGSRVSLAVALLAVVLASTVGTAYGAIAGFYGGRLDDVMMRVIDAALSIPRVLLLIAVLSLWGRISLFALVALLGLTGWFGVSRLVRAQVLAVRDQEMIVAARALGGRDRHIMWRHILPNVVATVVVAATLGIGNVIIIEAGLSYLGIGIQQPVASWGNIIRDGGMDVARHWWMSLFPGGAIVITVMAFNMAGDALRDALDPRQVHAS